ncbi:MAG: beta-1,6-N-acetylglucosaminyltransferase [Oscillospiraceae bacterium]|nr:beta-1,6-N-acetylglucosaminyltransferase [Oscillospiraceae bacterium]
MGKHAYLIIAHDKFEQLKRLLLLLDDERNDIYLHIDSKAKAFCQEEFEQLLSRAGLFFTERTSVIWGSYSQIHSELVLLKAAVPGHYSYYHLLSGTDLPIKSQDEIHAFFDSCGDREFIDFEGPVFREEKKVLLRYYYRFQEKHAGRSKWLDFLDQISIRLQKLSGVDRLAGCTLTLQKGANWFSITDGLAGYVVEMEPQIQKMFAHTKCCDEVFLQTLVVNSPYREKLSDPSMQGGEAGFMRHIDWNRGTPYTFRSEDFRELMTSPCMFARKFDEQVDAGIIDRIAEVVSAPPK